MGQVGESQVLSQSTQTALTNRPVRIKEGAAPPNTPGQIRFSTRAARTSRLGRLTLIFSDSAAPHCYISEGNVLLYIPENV